MAELFEGFAQFAKTEFGYIIKKSNKKSSFKEVFGFDARDIEPLDTSKEKDEEK